MDILVIGGSRFVGPLLVKRLLKKRHRITLFNRGLVQSRYGKKVKFIQGDRDEGFHIRDSFDAIIDMCAYSGAQTRAAIEGLDADFFVHIGTAAAYRKAEMFPLTEDSRLGEWPLWGDYNAGKVECEDVLRESGIRYASIRPVYILGPKNYADRERFIYSRLKSGMPLIIPGNGEALIQFVFARDVADSIALIAEKKAKGAFNCAGDEIISLKGLVGEMAKIAGRTPSFRFNPERDGDRFEEAEFPFANENLIVSNSKIKKLGVKFTPLQKGLKEDFVKYYSKAP